MKKYLFLILLIALTLTGCGATKSAKLVEEQQSRGKESNRIFDAWTGKTDCASYVIEKSGKMTKEKASAITKKIQEDADKVDAYFGSKTKKIPTIYVIESSVFSGQKMEYEYALGNVLYVSEEDVNNGNYLGMLIHMTRDIPQMWMCYGIAGEVSGKTSETKALKEFYSDEHNLETLLLSDVRFVQTIAKDNSDIAKKTAVAFWQSLKHEKNIQKYCKELANKNLTKEKNAWLQSMNINQKYESTFEGSMGKVKADYNSDFDLYATTPDAEFYVERGETTENNMETTPYYLERIFYNNMKGLAQIRELFKKENVLDLFPCNEKLTYYFKDGRDDAGGVANVQKGNRTIELYGRKQDEAHIHEAVHIYTVFDAMNKDNTRMDLAEGIATYVEDSISKEYAVEYLKIKDGQYDVGNGLYEHFNDQPEGLNKEIIDARKMLREYYLAQGGKLDTQEEFDGLLYADAFTHVNYTKLTSGNHTKDEELLLISYYNYFFNESFFHYIVDTYSFRKASELLLAVQKGESYESVMGKTEDEMKKEWLQIVGVN